MSNEPTTDLEPVKPADGQLSERMKYAQALAAADLLPAAYRRKPANVLLAMEYGYALGLDTVTAIQQVHVVEGKPTASAQLIGALVRRAGHRLRVTGDDKHAVAQIVRRDDTDFVFTSEWTLDRARAAGLAGKGSWAKYPGAMLKARAITEVARDACPEALAGVAYTPEELGADVPSWPTAEVVETPAQPLPAFDIETGELVEDAEIIEEPETEPAELASKAQLNAIAATLNKCGMSTREDRLNAVRHALGTNVDSSAELSKEQASVVLDTIKPLADAENPAAAFAKWYVQA